jgi:hypothetical protein
MPNQLTHTYIREHRGVNVFVLVLQREAGWIYEAKIECEQPVLALKLTSETHHTSEEDALNEAMKASKKRIDELLV